MTLGVYFDKKKCVETKKAQRYYALCSLYESMVFSFLTLFLNECRRSFNWTPLMSSFSLFLPPFVSAIAIFLSSFFVKHHRNNLQVMRVLTLLSFALVLGFGLTGLFVSNGLNQSGEIIDYSHYYGFYISCVTFIPLLMGMHWSFLSFQLSNAADINFIEKTRFGHICILAPLVSALASPIAGLLANSLFTNYRGYLFMFLVASPLLLLEFAFSFAFKPYDPSLLHHDETEDVPLKEVFSNKMYLFYLAIVAILIPSIWASDSIASSYWSSLEVTSDNAFNSLTYGFYLALSSLMEFLIIFFNTKVGFGKNSVLSINLALLFLFVGAISFGIISYFYRAPMENGLSLAIGIIFLHSFKGIANGLYCTSNLAIINHLLGPKARRKAVFLAPCLFQLINSFLQLAYPLLGEERYIAFFFIALLLFSALLGSFFLDGPLLHWKSKD